MLGFHCRPLDKFWDPELFVHCTSEGTLIAVVEGINSLGDFLLVALAVAIVPTLQVSRATKRKPIVLFGLGILAGAIGLGYLSTMIYSVSCNLADPLPPYLVPSSQMYLPKKGWLTCLI